MYKLDYLPTIVKLKQKHFQLHSSCMLFFISPLDCWFQRSEFNNTLLYQNEKGENSHKNIIPLLFTPLSPCKNHKKPEDDKKIQACERLILTQGFVFSFGVVAFKFLV